MRPIAGVFLSMVGEMTTVALAEFNETLDNVYDYIVRYKMRLDGISPTVRDIMMALNLSSTSITNHLLQVLEDQGRIKRVPHKAAGIMIVGGKWSLENAINEMST